MSKSTNKPPQVGKVNISYLSSDIDERYSDGKIEEDLLELFKGPGVQAKREEILDKNPSWEQYYHLSPLRGSIVDWYDFRPESSVLEIGAGCGAITESLVKKPIQVTALELTLRRTLVNAYRNQNADNLELLVGNLERMDSKDQYDYIVCVGVLEYAGTFIDHSSPYNEFLRLLAEKLKPSGRLLLAIENRLGLKYWAGAREDHTGNFFDGLNQYPTEKKVQTFGRLELESLFAASSFKKAQFFYPFPDYKHARLIYSDGYHPGNGAEFPLNQLPTPTYDQSRVVLFSEALAMIALEDNNLFPQFSNSFLVEATV
ncbi:MAG: class I SAM-dependent methyltransferase [Candidatus Saccharimonadales bacterium]